MTSYDAFARTFSNSRKNMKWAELDTIIDDIYNSGYTSILDIGCGNGRIIDNSKFKIQNYLGIDSSSGMIDEAKKLHGENHFEVCDMLFLESIYNYGTFDAIILLASFHHLETEDKRIKVLKDIQKLLSPHGSVYMTNWNLREQPRYEKSRRKITEISQKQEVQGREIFSKGVYSSVNEGEQNFSDNEIRSFSEISYDFDIKIGEFSRYYHGFTTEELYELFRETGWNIMENRIFEGERNIYSKIRKN